jgi:hypothetical protein
MGPPTLEDRGSYATDLEAWSAVLRDPRLIVADPQFLHEGGPPGFAVRVGDHLRVSDPISGNTREVTVAAIATGDGLIANGMLYGARGAHRLFGEHLAPSRSFVASSCFSPGPCARQSPRPSRLHCRRRVSDLPSRCA